MISLFTVEIACIRQRNIIILVIEGILIKGTKYVVDFMINYYADKLSALILNIL